MNSSYNTLAQITSYPAFSPETSSGQVLDECTAMFLGISRSALSLSSSRCTNNVVMEQLNHFTASSYMSVYYAPPQQPLLSLPPAPSSLPPSPSESFSSHSPALQPVAPLSPSHSSTSDKQSFFCGQCPKHFSSKRSLSRHIASSHNGSKYHCIICQTVVSRKDALTRHLRKSNKCKEHLARQRKQHAKAPSQHFSPGAVVVVDRYMPYPSPPPL